MQTTGSDPLGEEAEEEELYPLGEEVELYLLEVEVEEKPYPLKHVVLDLYHV